MAKGKKGKPHKRSTKTTKGVPTKTVSQSALGPAAEEFGKEIKPLGKAAGEVANLAGGRALQTVRGLFTSYDRLKVLVRKALEARVPADKRVDPNPRLAAPIIHALTYSVGEEVIREMFLNLLAADMHADQKEKTHPSFVEIIKELTPADARVLATFRNTPHVEFVAMATAFGKQRDLRHSMTIRLEHLNPDQYMRAVNNLCRLGLVEKRWNVWPVAPHLDAMHDKFLESCNDLKESIKDAEVIKEFDIGPSVKFEIARHGLYLTALGSDFVEICLKDIN